MPGNVVSIGRGTGKDAIQMNVWVCASVFCSRGQHSTNSFGARQITSYPKTSFCFPRWTDEIAYAAQR